MTLVWAPVSRQQCRWPWMTPLLARISNWMTLASGPLSRQQCRWHGWHRCWQEYWTKWRWSEFQCLDNSVDVMDDTIAGKDVKPDNAGQITPLSRQQCRWHGWHRCWRGCRTEWRWPERILSVAPLLRTPWWLSPTPRRRSATAVDTRAPSASPEHKNRDHCLVLVWRHTVSSSKYTKKRWAKLPSLSRLSLSKLFLGGSNLFIPALGEFDIPRRGAAKSPTFFVRCKVEKKIFDF